MSVEVRPPLASELGAVGKLAAEMVRFHHQMNPRRFQSDGATIEDGYRRFLTLQAEEKASVVLVAVDGESGVAGYVYARLEGPDWNRLLGPHGKIHDVVVDGSARRRGHATKLLREAITRLRALGAERIVLDTARQNEAAQKFFESMGFEPTMIEMMLDSPTKT